MQDILGDLQDGVVAADLLAGVAAGNPESPGGLQRQRRRQGILTA